MLDEINQSAYNVLKSSIPQPLLDLCFAPSFPPGSTWATRVHDQDLVLEMTGPDAADAECGTWETMQRAHPKACKCSQR